MKRLLILLVRAGAVAACGPDPTSSPSLLAPDASAGPTEAPLMESAEASSSP